MVETLGEKPKRRFNRENWKKLNEDEITTQIKTRFDKISETMSEDVSFWKDGYGLNLIKQALQTLEERIALLIEKNPKIQEKIEKMRELSAIKIFSYHDKRETNIPDSIMDRTLEILGLDKNKKEFILGEARWLNFIKDIEGGATGELKDVLEKNDATRIKSEKLTEEKDKTFKKSVTKGILSSLRNGRFGSFESLMKFFPDLFSEEELQKIIRHSFYLKKYDHKTKDDEFNPFSEKDVEFLEKYGIDPEAITRATGQLFSID